MNRRGYPLVSIVFLNFNGRKFVNLWRPLFLLDYHNYEIIFVDNGSRDDSYKLFEKIASKYPNVKVKMLILKRNVGYSKANNIAIRKATGEYIVLLSNDIEVDRHFLKNMIKFLEKNKEVAVAQSLMFNLYNRNEIDKMGNFLSVIGHNVGQSYLTYKDKKDPFEVFYSEGAVMFIRKKILEETNGLFDDDFFMLFEDVDFCWRVHLRGHKVCVVPSSIVYHVRGGTVSGTIMKLDPFYVFTNTRNRLLSLFKNYEVKNLLKYFPFLLIAEVLKGLWLITITRKPKAGIAVFKGICDFIFKIPIAYKKRKKVQRLRIVKDDKIINKMTPLSKSISLVWGKKESF